MQERLRYRPVRARILAVLLTLLTLGGCGGSVIVVENFPRPVVEPLPMRVGLYMAPGFQDFVYQSPDEKIEFEFGSKQSELYRTVFSALFLQSVEIADRSGAANVDLDLIMEPVLEEYAFLTPAETATEFFAVSLKYQIRLYTGDGELIGYWPFVAYGKNRTKLLNKYESLGNATSTALRDAAAAMVSQFRAVLRDQSWSAPDVVAEAT